MNKGARLVIGCTVRNVVIEGGRVTGVQARQGWRTVLYPADLVVLAAGGLGTPVILQDSGLDCYSRLFVDPVLTVAGKWPDSMQNTEMTMPFVVQREDYILSPYFDFLSFFFSRKRRYPARHTLGIMIKLADANQGSISSRNLDKTLTPRDRAKLEEAMTLCTDILASLGVSKDSLFLGTINAGHPGGMLPLSAREAETFHHRHLPENLYVADASLFPRSLGNPPIMTIMAMAKRVSRICAQRA